MKVPLYQVDAFAGQIFSGNPAGVCVLKKWPADEVLQTTTAKNKLPETAFLVPASSKSSKRAGNGYELRCFSPKMELDLCEHATLAGGFVVMNYIDEYAEQVDFETKSGILSVGRIDDLYILDFPSRKARVCEPPSGLEDILGEQPIETLRATRDYIVVFENENRVRELRPDFEAMLRLDCLGVIVTSAGDKSDFVSRFFAPAAGISEDPVTGSAHCSLIPYWSKKFGWTKLHAFQISKQGAELFCEDRGERVSIGGYAELYQNETIQI